MKLNAGMLYFTMEDDTDETLKDTFLKLAVGHAWSLSIPLKKSQ